MYTVLLIKAVSAGCFGIKILPPPKTHSKKIITQNLISDYTVTCTLQYIQKQPHFASIFRRRLAEIGRHLQPPEWPDTFPWALTGLHNKVFAAELSVPPLEGANNALQIP